MGEDREILREIWDGRVPVCISLASEDCCTLSTPEAHYLLVPRMSYFPLVTEKVRKHFLRSVSAELQNSEMWLEYEGVPLKWHYPIGLLFDLHTVGTALPWSVVAHFSNFPEKQLPRCPGRDAVEAHFFSSVKEADAFKHRGQIMKNMQLQDHKQLWIGLCNDRFDQFWAVNRKLMDTIGEEGFRYIPFRIYFGNAPPIQRLQRPFDEDGRKLTLEDLLNNTTQVKEGDRIIVQGIEPPWDTPLQWLSEHLSYPDNFLHISVIQTENSVFCD